MNGCKYASNNQYFNAPARMADGRLFTNYKNSYEMNKALEKQVNVNGPEQYRKYLNKNSLQLRKQLDEQRCEKVCTYPCMDPKRGTLVPEKVMETCGKNNCRFTLSYSDGVGMGRGNTNINAPEDYKCVKKTNNCCIPPEMGRGFYGNVLAKGEKTCTRPTVLGGTPKQGGDPVAYNIPL